MAKMINIDHEKKILPYFSVSSFLLLITGLTIWLLQGKGQAAQLTALVHLVIALPWACLFIHYLTLHFARTIGSRKLGLNSSGIMLVLLVISMIASGSWLAVAGFDHTVSLWHLITTWLLTGFFIAHCLQSYKHLQKSSKALQQLPRLNRHMTHASLASTAMITVLISLAAWFFIPGADDFYQKIADYSQDYGKNPFAPSKTRTPEQQFVTLPVIGNSDNCRSCHADIYQQWRSSIHRYAAADPTYVRNVSLLENNKGIAATRYCEGCHAPIAMLTGELTPGGKHGGIAGTPAFDEGISCRSCHSIDSIVSTEGVASYHYRPSANTVFELADNALLRKINHLATNTLPASHKQGFANPVLQTATFCASCHAQFMDERLNDWGWVKMQDDYSAWLNSPYSGRHDKTYSADKSMTCQDCHMPLVRSDDPSADKNGLVRSHRFATANTFVARHFGENEQLETIIDFMQTNRMRITIDEPRRKQTTETVMTVEQRLKQHKETPYFFYLGETVSLNILVSNIGVGHDFPGGTIDLNQAWIHLEVLDSHGKTVMVSGDIDDHGFVDPDARIYKATPIDRHGREVWRHDLFNMTGESYRNVIKAGATDRVEYQLSVPAWVQSPLTIFATLKYRKLNRRYIEWAMEDKNTPPITVIDVARTSLQIPVLKQPPVYFSSTAPQRSQ